MVNLIAASYRSTIRTKSLTIAAPSTSFEDQNQSESMNSTENAIFENSMNNTSAQNQLPDRTSTPLPNAVDTIVDQNHCTNESTMSPTREKSPSWDQQQSNTNASTTDNDTLDSEVRNRLFCCFFLYILERMSMCINQ